MESIEDIVGEVLAELQETGYVGYDPYDLLNSDAAYTRLPDPVLFVLSQVNKRSPLNIRRLLGVKKGLIPKGKALIVKSMIKLESEGWDFPDHDELARDLILDQCPGYHGACWGLPFDYANREYKRTKMVGDVVATAFVHDALVDYYHHRREEKVRELLLTTPSFLEQDLQLRPNGTGMVINYSAEKDSFVLNALGFAAEIYLRCYALTRKEEYVERARGLLQSIVWHQDANGLFPYAIVAGQRRYQTDFHQLYVVHSLAVYKSVTGETLFEGAMCRGIDFFIDNQMSPEGHVYWRLPKKYPIDIHNQASAIYYLLRLRAHHSIEMGLINKLITATIKGFYLPEKRVFAYQRYSWCLNRVPYIRWGQAWSLLALSEAIVQRANT